MRYRLVRIALVLVVGGGLVALGYNRFEAWRYRPSQTWHLAATTTIAGFVRTNVIDLPGGQEPLADAYFIGPAPKPDPAAVVLVPTIQLRDVDPTPIAPFGKKPDSLDTVARGHRSDGCEATVLYDSDPQLTVGLAKGEHEAPMLTDEQIDAVRNGSQVFIIVIVSNCGW